MRSGHCKGRGAQKKRAGFCDFTVAAVSGAHIASMTARDSATDMEITDLEVTDLEVITDLEVTDLEVITVLEVITDLEVTDIILD